MLNEIFFETSVKKNKRIKNTMKKNQNIQLALIKDLDKSKTR